MRRVSFFQTGLILGLATRLSCEFKPRANGLASLGLLSCSATAGATVQLLTCLARVQTFGDLQAVTHPWDPVARFCFFAQSWAFLHNLEHFFTLSHSLPLQVSHLNTGLLSAELQVNWHGIKPTRWLIKFNLTISPFGYSVTKPYNRL